MEVKPFLSAVKTAIKQGGGTFDTSGKLIEKDFGYWVGGYQRIPSPYSHTPVTPRYVETVAKRIELLVGDLCMSMGPEDAIGLWVDDGLLYVDVSRYFRNRTKAIAAGIANDQKAIYDIANRADIDLSGPELLLGGVEQEEQTVTLTPESTNPGKVLYKKGAFVRVADQSLQGTFLLVIDVYETDSHAMVFNRETGENVLVLVSTISPAQGYERLNNGYVPFVSPRVEARWGRRQRVY